MKVHYFITVKGIKNGKELYQNIEQFGANLTDMGGECIVYGDCYLAQLSQIVYNCALYGNITADITH